MKNTEKFQPVASESQEVSENSVLLGVLQDSHSQIFWEGLVWVEHFCVTSSVKSGINTVFLPLNIYTSEQRLPVMTQGVKTSLSLLGIQEQQPPLIMVNPTLIQINYHISSVKYGINTDIYQLNIQGNR